MKKTFSFFEYATTLIIVVGALSGSYYFLKRLIQAHIKREANTFLGRVIGLEWPEQTQSISWQSTKYNRLETEQGQKATTSEVNFGSVTYSAPVGSKIMKHKRASRDVPDSALSPPNVEYPELEYKDWEDKGWPLH